MPQEFRPDETLEEYVRAQTHVLTRVHHGPTETLWQPGTMPWHSTEYELDDLMMYAYYVRKREHMAHGSMFHHTHC